MPMKVDVEDPNVRRGMCKAVPRVQFKSDDALKAQGRASEQIRSGEFHWEANGWHWESPGANKPSSWNWSSESTDDVTWWSRSWDSIPPSVPVSMSCSFAHPDTEHSRIKFGEEWSPEPIYVKIPLSTLFHPSFSEVHEMLINCEVVDCKVPGSVLKGSTSRQSCYLPNA